MLQYFRFHADLPHLQSAKPVYIKRGKGSGWPEHCPPIRAANAYGWDVLNPFDMIFTRDPEGHWAIEEAVEVHSDIELEGSATPHPQLNAWFWEKGQQRPHVITDNVYAAIRHQCKVSTFLYLQTDPGWVLAMRAIPNRKRDWSVIESVLETDWYKPAHPWHGVIELPRIEESAVARVHIPAGEPIFRLLPLQRADYRAVEMPGEAFGDLFEQGQRWLSAHGKAEQAGEVDITGAYARQQDDSKFTVQPEGSNGATNDG